MHSDIIGTYTYRSWNNLTDLNVTNLNELLFGEGFIEIKQVNAGSFSGRIYGTGDNRPSSPAQWSLELFGSVNYGNPVTLRFQGKGVNGGNEWIYDYVAYLILPWPNGVDQKTVLTGSIVRQIPHPGGNGGLHPAGATATWYAVKN